MTYTEVNILISPIDPCRDLIVDALGNDGPYDSFVDTPEGVKAYVPAQHYDSAWLNEQMSMIKAMFHDVKLSYVVETLPDKDWNEEWERQHKPVMIEADGGVKIWVRAPFHPLCDDADYQVEIEPKMSFGTAHHPTTCMMASYVAELPMEGRRVLDMGCGTALLAILAKMRGAAYVEAIDVDEWAYRNAIENAGRNGVEINVRLGDASLLAQSASGQQGFDIILANINRNILLADMPRYVSALKPGGSLVLSGFYQADVEALKECASRLGMELSGSKQKEDWCALEMKKKVD